MTGSPSTFLFIFLIIFCRIGACLMFAPGFASPRVPMQVRFLIALAVSVAIAPMIWAEASQAIMGLNEAEWIFLPLSEIIAGSAIGLMTRCFILALQFAATATANLIGLSGIPGVAIEDADTGSPISTLVSISAVMLIMHVGLHLELLEALLDSYEIVPPAREMAVNIYLSNLLQTIAETWRLALQLAAPFIMYAVIVNFALGLANRFAQQISVYHATTGAVIVGGIGLMWLVWSDWMMIFLTGYQTWLQRGGF